MFGRAGRRGLDDTGFILFTPSQPRLSFARPRQLKRATQVDWPSLISVMANAADRAAPRCVVPGPPVPTSAIPAAEPPPAGDSVPGYRAALELSRSLFSVQDVALGVEHSLATGPKPCGLWVDAERARFVRRPITEILNSAEEWEPRGELIESSLGQALRRENECWIPALRLPQTLDQFRLGNLCRLGEKKIYGREWPLATAVADQGELQLVKPLRKLLRAKTLPEDELRARVTESLPEWSGGGLVDEFVRRGNLLSVRIDFSTVKIEAARRDSLGRILLDPPEHSALSLACRNCSELEHDQTVEIVASPAYAWRRLGLVEPDGTPTRRGVVFGFFQGGEGLALAAALEDESYPIDDLVFDLANIRAGPRFAGDDAP
ncbi:hypothetical protein BH18VER2_BH18VER2_13960 [soil metagenome]